MREILADAHTAEGTVLIDRQTTGEWARLCFYTYDNLPEDDKESHEAQAEAILKLTESIKRKLDQK